MLVCDVYYKEDQSSLVNLYGQFIYEMCIFIQYENIYSLVKRKLFFSDKEIENIVSSFNYSKYITIECSLYAAPKQWLLDNDFKLYVKEKKKSKSKNKKNEEPIINPVECNYRRSSSKTTLSRIKKL